MSPSRLFVFLTETGVKSILFWLPSKTSHQPVSHELADIYLSDAA